MGIEISKDQAKQLITFLETKKHWSTTSLRRLVLEYFLMGKELPVAQPEVMDPEDHPMGEPHVAS